MISTTFDGPVIGPVDIFGAGELMASSNTDTDLTYILGEKDDLLIVLFQGKINSRAEPVFEQLQIELGAKPHKLVIFVFRDVSSFMPGPHLIFARIQKGLRDAGRSIAVCSLKPEIKQSLANLGIIRESEFFNNIPDAWQALKTRAVKGS